MVGINTCRCFMISGCRSVARVRVVAGPEFIGYAAPSEINLEAVEAYRLIVSAKRTRRARYGLSFRQFDAACLVDDIKRTGKRALKQRGWA